MLIDARIESSAMGSGANAAPTPIHSLFPPDLPPSLFLNLQWLARGARHWVRGGKSFVSKRLLDRGRTSVVIQGDRGAPGKRVTSFARAGGTALAATVTMLTAARYLRFPRFRLFSHLFG